MGKKRFTLPAPVKAAKVEAPKAPPAKKGRFQSAQLNIDAPVVKKPQQRPAAAFGSQVAPVVVTVYNITDRLG